MGSSIDARGGYNDRHLKRLTCYFCERKVPLPDRVVMLTPIRSLAVFHSACADAGRSVMLFELGGLGKVIDILPGGIWRQV